MKRISLNLPLLLLILSMFVYPTRAAQSDYQLEQILILSRHNVRAPLSDNDSVLTQATHKPWPKWEVPGGDLTTKGGVLEVYMGRYVRDWLVENHVVPQEGCPTAGSMYVYANGLQRTIATAQFFVAGAFPGCDIPVHHQEAIGTMDPVFNPILTAAGPAIDQAQASAAMAAKAKEIHLEPGYQILERIAGYKHSSFCIKESKCDLASMESKPTVNYGKQPNFEADSPLNIGNSIVDAFTLQYYEGFPLRQVAWGRIKTKQEWEQLSAIKNDYQNMRFSVPQIARNVAAPLLDYIYRNLVEKDKKESSKITLLVGHDANISALMTAMHFRQYQLPDQYEKTPIGGELVFQRWHDTGNNRDLFKVEYVYQSTEQLRNTEKLSLAHPPRRVTLELEDCPADARGFCPWDRFAQVMSQLTEQRR